MVRSKGVADIGSTPRCHSKTLAWLAVLLAPVLLLPSAVASPGASRDLLPDLVTRKPATIFLQVTKRGKRLIRFSNEVVNVGIGPLELRPHADDCNHDGNLGDDRTSYQRIYRDTDGDGRFTRRVDVRLRTRNAGCTRFHPAHNHWHFEALAEYALHPLQVAGPPGPLPSVGAEGERVRAGHQTAAADAAGLSASDVLRKRRAELSPRLHRRRLDWVG